MNKTSYLHSLVKQKSQEKNCPLKIVADWDDCLQSAKPIAIYKGTNPPLSISFKELFHNFWKGTTMKCGSILGPNEITEYLGNEEEKNRKKHDSKR